LESLRQSNAGDDRQQWLVTGAGRLGRGFLNLVANEYSYKSLLVVAGENTRQADVDVFNGLRETGDGYLRENRSRSVTSRLGRW
jgi:hypothetical protein